MITCHWKSAPTDVLSDSTSKRSVSSGQTLTIHISGGSVQVNDATVIKADILASNGIIHVIDKVLLPK